MEQIILDQIYEHACDLLATSEEYWEAVDTGYFRAHLISKEHASNLSQQFLIRADAIFLLHDSLKKELDKTV